MTPRLILGAFILAQVAHAQSVAKPSLATRTAQHETETGSWRAGDAMVWVRVAPTGAISVYASHGYRSAFAHAVIITPADAEKWAEIGDHVLAGQTGGGTIMLADSDLALEPERAGDSVALVVRLGGIRPDGITFLMNGQALRDVTPILRATANASRATQAANAAPPPPAAAPTAPVPAAASATTQAVPTTQAAPTQVAPTTTAAPVAAQPVPAQPPAPHTAAISAPAPATPVVLASAPSAPAAPPEVATPDTPAAPAPEAEVAPGVSTPVTPAAAAPTIAPAPTITPAPTIAPSKPAQVATTTAPTVAATKTAKVTNAKPARQSTETASLRRTSAGSIAKPAAASAHTDQPTDATKLAESTVANLVKQWQSQLDLCYTEYGLKVNPALTGSIAVRLAIRPTGDVAAATFTRHKWSGTAGSTEAESCMRARAMAWMFPPASTPSVHVFTVAFAP